MERSNRDITQSLKAANKNENPVSLMRDHAFPGHLASCIQLCLAKRTYADVQTAEAIRARACNYYYIHNIGVCFMFFYLIFCQKILSRSFSSLQVIYLKLNSNLDLDKNFIVCGIQQDLFRLLLTELASVVRAFYVQRLACTN